MFGVALTLWSIRLALVCYAIVLAWWLAGARVTPQVSQRLRGIWTAGCLLFVAHVLAAFQFFHHWSHQHAIDDTAQQTEKLIGWAFGEGLYFSYAFLILWLMDAAWWWLSERTYLTRPAWVGGLLHGYLLFIAFNGAVVFKTGITRWAGITAAVLFAALLVRRGLRIARALPNREPTSPDPQPAP